QERIGQYGERFTFLKFRTMYINNDPKVHQEYINKFILEQKSYDTNEKKGNKDEVFKIKDDPRVTFVGKFLRKTSLDELPQFLNVLKGEMSIVGPRPPVPYEVKIYDIWHKRRLMEVKPGITGLWQTKGRSSTTFDEMVRLDIRYIIGWSVWLDIKIILLTPWVVLTGKGAY
ncbi:MAG TPA: glycosyl transferase, partial [Nitrospiraceae bacterium]|nr:glycosyl transferase [Nitrospiraceae bacterium]